MATKRSTNAVNASLDVAFFSFIWYFYQSNRAAIRAHYKELTRKFLDFNNPDKNPKAFLRQPQFEALEVYVFLKEFLDNARVEEIFQQWYEKQGHFAGRAEGGLPSSSAGQSGLFDQITQDQYQAVFSAMRKNSRAYPNYIFALTMGTGKTILMATCIFYEFLLGNKFEKDARYCHNALVFAPDKTVLQSLKEIETFDLTRVVPPEYVSFLTKHLRFHYLEEAGTSLNTLDRSRFNIIVSNTQKIILKRHHKEKSSVERLFGTSAESPVVSGVYADNSDLYDYDQPEEEGELTTNQRFEKLRRLGQLGIFVDEAHHAFGKALAKDMGVGTKETDTSLRTTIDMLAASLDRAGTRVVACYNYTGTPYVGRDVLPEVVYAYGLKEAIDKAYLKKVTLHGYANTRNEEFVEIAINNFLRETEGIQPEGISPKLAFFAATIDELTKELKPAVERALLKHGIPTSRILVNVGDDKITTNDDIREFNRLDTAGSEKQFILLVNKGREGWNCRSLFGVGLFRAPKSKVFVLQATMRCLRAIGQAQYTGHVYLSDENMAILNDELQENFRLTVDEFKAAGSDRERVQVRVTQPPVKFRLARIRKHYKMEPKEFIRGQALGIGPVGSDAWKELVAKYRITEEQRDGLNLANANRSMSSTIHDLTSMREKRKFTSLTLVAEISRYLNTPPLEIEDLLTSTAEGVSQLVEMVNEFNEVLYDEIIPRLFKQICNLVEEQQEESIEVELVKNPPEGYYEVSAQKDKIVRVTDVADDERAKSFHLDTYCFDSYPEVHLFRKLLADANVENVYFTGMLTHGQSDFYVQYIDPESYAVRSYYPDFVCKMKGNTGSWTYALLEVKADNQLDDAVVLAKKDYAEQLANASGWQYLVIKASEAERYQIAPIHLGERSARETKHAH